MKKVGKETMNGYVWVIVGYSVVMIAAGFWLTKRVKGADDFFVAGRNLSAGMLFSTLLAANIGAGSTVGVAGLAYRYGVSAWWWIGASGLGSLLLAFWVGPKIYRLARTRGYLTLGDYLEDRYSKSFRGLISFFMGIGTLAIFAGQLIGIAWILQVVANVEKLWGILLAAVVVVIYSAVGGLKSAAVVNLIQIIIKISGFLLAAPAALYAVGGFDGLVEKVSIASAATPGKEAAFFSWDGIGISMMIGFFLMLTPSFFVSPGLIGKVYGAKDEAAVRKGTAWNGIIQLLFGFLVIFLGMCVYAIHPDLANSELALPIALKELMPFAISALALAAIFSAEVSSADAVLYMIAGSWANDVYKGIFKPGISSERLLYLSRWVMVVAGVAGVLLAIQLPNIISSLTIFYTLMSVCLTVPMVFGLFTKRATNVHAISSAVVGIGITLGLQFFAGGKGLWILNAQSTGILASLVVMVAGIGISSMMKKSEES